MSGLSSIIVYYPERDACTVYSGLFLAAACLSGNIFRRKTRMFIGPYGHAKWQETIPFYSRGFLGVAGLRICVIIILLAESIPCRIGK